MTAGFREEYRKKHLMRKPIVWGIVAGTVLLSIYFSTLAVANSFSHALQQFGEMWYWIALLVAGFGTQVGLYAYIKTATKLRASTGAATSSVAAAGGMSTTSMIACCAHHVTDVIPVLGVSAAAVFLAQFQTLFIVIGVLSNLIGINLMLKIIQKHHLYHGADGFFSSLMRVDMKKSLCFTSSFSAVTFLIVLFISL
jgi:hypothetical protein